MLDLGYTGVVGCGRTRLISVVDPILACISQYFMDLVGLSQIAELWVGQIKDLLPRILEEFGGIIFHKDVLVAEHLVILAHS